MRVAELATRRGPAPAGPDWLARLRQPLSRWELLMVPLQPIARGSPEPRAARIARRHTASFSRPRLRFEHLAAGESQLVGT